MDEAPPEPGGLLVTGTRILHSLISLGRSRLELFLVEVQEERLRLFGALVLLGACLMFAFMALALGTLTVAVIFWEQHRIVVLVSLTTAYAVGAGWSFWALRRRLLGWQSFSATLEQFKKDQACLEKPN